MKKLLIANFLISILSAKQIQITPEFGINVGIIKDIYYGAYGRLWLGVDKFVIAPQVRWENNNKYSNIKGGVIIGGEATNFLTPYVGASYSYFDRQYEDSFDLEAGLVFFLPFFSIGIYVNWGMSEEIVSRKTKHLIGGGASLGIPL